MLKEPCKLWTGCTTGGGYGMKYTPEGNRYVHRLEWEKHNGPIPKNMHIAHRCDNPACYEISHLFLASASENAKDCVKKNRHPRAKLTRDQVIEIKKSLQKRIPVPSLAKAFNISRGAVYKIKNGQSWSNVQVN